MNRMVRVKARAMICPSVECGLSTRFRFGLSFSMAFLLTSTKVKFRSDFQLNFRFFSLFDFSYLARISTPNTTQNNVLFVFENRYSRVVSIESMPPKKHWH